MQTSFLSRQLCVQHLTSPPLSQRFVTKCSASDAEIGHINRRGMGLLSSMAALTWASDALALLPDDDDVELVQKAKAKRKARLQKELASERQFARTEGLKNAEDAQLIDSVQKAVFNLAKSGSRLDSGDLDEVSTLLKDAWVAEFEAASNNLSIGVDGADKEVKTILSGLASLQSAAQKGDLKGSKKLYVAVVDVVEDWTKRTGIESKLKGL